MVSQNMTILTMLSVNLSSQNAISVQSKRYFSKMMIWVCVIFNLKVFIYMIHPHTKNYEYLHPILFNVTYERFVMNVKINPKSKVKR
jgi:hypothetical protein